MDFTWTNRKINKQEVRYLKIIKNNYKDDNTNFNNNYPTHTKCVNCSSELEVTKEDTHIGYFGLNCVTCPCCGKETYIVEDLDCETLTIDSIEFPVHFIRTNKEKKGVVEIDDGKITEYIKGGIKYFRDNKNEYVYYVSTGDMFVIIFRHEEDEDYFILGTKDFYETYVNFEEEDY